jgi:hypothetical protein
MSRQPNTPGSLGYVLGALASFVCCTPLLLVPALFDGGSIGDAIMYFPIGLVIVAVCGSPVAVAGVVVVQVLCSRVDAQLPHVLVAGLAGFGFTLLYVRAFGVDDPGLATVVLAAVVAVAAGFGRAAVIPLVESRRRLAAQGRLTGTARW